MMLWLWLALDGGVEVIERTGEEVGEVKTMWKVFGDDFGVEFASCGSVLGLWTLSLGCIS